jgi:hypothetical protein
MYKSARGFRLTSWTISYTHSATYKSVRGSRLTSLIIFYTFYTCIAAYKKQGAPDRCYIQLLLLSTRASLRTKSKWLQIDAPYIFYYFQHVHRRVQKARDSIGIYSIFSIWLTTFLKSICSSTDIIIDDLARPITQRVCLLVFIGTQGSKWARDRHLSWLGMLALIDS